MPSGESGAVSLRGNGRDGKADDPGANPGSANGIVFWVLVIHGYAESK